MSKYEVLMVKLKCIELKTELQERRLKNSGEELERSIREVRALEKVMDDAMAAIDKGMKVR